MYKPLKLSLKLQVYSIHILYQPPIQIHYSIVSKPLWAFALRYPKGQTRESQVPSSVTCHIIVYLLDYSYESHERTMILQQRVRKHVKKQTKASRDSQALRRACLAVNRFCTSIKEVHDYVRLSNLKRCQAQALAYFLYYFCGSSTSTGCSRGVPSPAKEESSHMILQLLVPPQWTTTSLSLSPLPRSSYYSLLYYFH